MYIGGGKYQSLSNLRRERVVQRRETGQSSAETVVEITDYRKITILHVEAGVDMRYIKTAGGIPDQMQAVVSFEITPPYLTHYRSNYCADLVIELFSDLRSQGGSIGEG